MVRVIVKLIATCAGVILAAVLLSAQQAQYVPAPGAELLHRPLDQILDVNVRDGLVYYRVLKAERGRLDRYIASLNVAPATYKGWSKEQQMAFWVNAYNAFVLETVINHYPLHGTIKQIPGAFDKNPFHAAGRTVTLDQIEKTILPEFKEPRLYLALGRGAVGSGRLRSEAYTGDRLERQLADIESEFVNDRHMYQARPGRQHHVGDADHELARSRLRRRLRRPQEVRAEGRPPCALRAASPISDAGRSCVRVIGRTCCRSEKELVQQERVQDGVLRDGLASERSQRSRGIGASEMERPTKRPRNGASLSEGPEGTAAKRRPRAPNNGLRTHRQGRDRHRIEPRARAGQRAGAGRRGLPCLHLRARRGAARGSGARGRSGGRSART